MVVFSSSQFFASAATLAMIDVFPHPDSPCRTIVRFSDSFRVLLTSCRNAVRPWKAWHFFWQNKACWNNSSDSGSFVEASARSRIPSSIRFVREPKKSRQRFSMYAECLGTDVGSIPFCDHWTSYWTMLLFGKASGRCFSRSCFKNCWAGSSAAGGSPQVLSMNFPAFFSSIFFSRSVITRLNQKQCFSVSRVLMMPRRISSSVTEKKRSRILISRINPLFLGMYLPLPTRPLELTTTVSQILNLAQGRVDICQYRSPDLKAQTEHAQFSFENYVY